MAEHSPPRVNATERSVEVLDAVVRLEDPRLTTVADHLDLPYSTVHNHLRTLEHLDCVHREDDRFRPGLRLLEYGSACRDARPLSRVAPPEIDDLADRVGELSSLMVAENGYGTYLHCAKGEGAIPFDPDPGTHTYLNQTALGKAILAAEPDDRIESVLERHGLPARTDRTVTDREELRAELDRIRERGYAVDDGEYMAGCRCVAVSLAAPDGGVAGAISVSGPERRIADAEATLREELQSTANVIELKLASAESP